MADHDMSGLDAIDAGPIASDTTTIERAASTADPTGHPTVAALFAAFADDVYGHRVSAGDQHVIFLAEARSLEILTWLRDDEGQRYDFVRDVTAVDYGGGRPLQVVYQLWSNAYKRTLRLKVELPLDRLSIESVVSLWVAANWLEREVYDLFGITFRNHPDLRRILMPMDYAEGHPLRKDFPLRGRFSRAEQTRRALHRDLDRDYTAHDLEVGREPQEVALPSRASGDSPTPEPDAGTR